MKLARIITLLVLPITWACALAQESGAVAEEDLEQAAGPWIEAFYIYLAPTMACLHGKGFAPGATLWLDVTDPLGTVRTVQVVSDGDGRIVADVPVDEPGVHQTQVRDGTGQVLSEGNLLVGLQ